MRDDDRACRIVQVFFDVPNVATADCTAFDAPQLDDHAAGVEVQASIAGRLFRRGESYGGSRAEENRTGPFRLQDAPFDVRSCGPPNDPLPASLPREQNDHHGCESEAQEDGRFVNAHPIPGRSVHLREDGVVPKEVVAVHDSARQCPATKPLGIEDEPDQVQA